MKLFLRLSRAESARCGLVRKGVGQGMARATRGHLYNALWASAAKKRVAAYKVVVCMHHPGDPPPPVTLPRPLASRATPDRQLPSFPSWVISNCIGNTTNGAGPELPGQSGLHAPAPVPVGFNGTARHGTAGRRLQENNRPGRTVGVFAVPAPQIHCFKSELHYILIGWS